MIRIQEPGIDLDGAQAAALQVEGTVDGYPAYFRAMGQHWELTIAETEDAAIDGGEGPGVLFSTRRFYDPEGSGFGAGYMETDVVERLIREQVAAFRAGRGELREESTVVQCGQDVS